MQRPTYYSNPTLEDFFLVKKYGDCRSAVYCCLADLLDLHQCRCETATDLNNLRFLVTDIYNMGRINGIREERHSRKMKNHSEPVQPIAEPKSRAELMQEIIRRLESADLRKLRLVWVYVSHLITREH